MVVVNIAPKIRWNCECAHPLCPQCKSYGWGPMIGLDDIYDIIKNPPPAPVGQVTHVYSYAQSAT